MLETIFSISSSPIHIVFWYILHCLRSHLVTMTTTIIFIYGCPVFCGTVNHKIVINYIIICIDLKHFYWKWQQYVIQMSVNLSVIPMLFFLWKCAWVPCVEITERQQWTFLKRKELTLYLKVICNFINFHCIRNFMSWKSKVCVDSNNFFFFFYLSFMLIVLVNLRNT